MLRQSAGRERRSAAPRRRGRRHHRRHSREEGASHVWVRGGAAGRPAGEFGRSGGFHASLPVNSRSRSAVPPCLQVSCVGQMICAVLADTRAHAKRGAAAVKIGYEDLPQPVFTVEVCNRPVGSRRACRAQQSLSPFPLLFVTGRRGRVLLLPAAEEDPERRRRRGFSARRPRV